MKVDFFQLLKENKLMHGLSEAQVRQVEELVRAETFPAETVLVRQAEAPDRVFLLAEGRVRVRRGQQNLEENAIAELGPGSFFGEMAVITGAAEHTASVIALTPVTVLSLSTVEFVRLISDYPEITRNMLSNIIVQLQGLNNKWLDTLRVEKQVLEWKVRERTQELEAMNQRVHRELMLAQNIQRNLLPEKRKSYPGVSIATDYVPCDELGGDITGVFQVDESRLAVYGGDVCGHGIYAAMVMSYVKKLIETSVKRILLNRQYIVKPPGAVLTSINQSFIMEISQGDPEIYLTLFLGVLDIRRLTFDYSSAGIHVPPIILSGGKALELFQQSDFPIGHVASHEYETFHRAFLPGDVFVFVSDGVIEAQRGRAVFGRQKLMEEIENVHRSTGSVDVDSIVGSVRTFLEGEPPQDDMCVLTISFDAPADPVR
jgi:sigma-B regulation protein RsbU (phosphoserine phosphatase)